MSRQTHVCFAVAEIAFPAKAGIDRAAPQFYEVSRSGRGAVIPAFAWKVLGVLAFSAPENAIGKTLGN